MDRSKGYSTGLTKNALVEMLTADLDEFLNERYAYYEIDKNEDRDSEWVEIATTALRLAMGNVQETDWPAEDAPPSTCEVCGTDFEAGDWVEGTPCPVCQLRLDVH